MKRKTIRFFCFWIFLLFFFVPTLRAQTAPTATSAPLSPLQHFTLSGTATGVAGVGGSQGATILEADFSITKNVTFGYQQIIVPSSANSFDLGVIEYTRPLSALLGKKVSSALTFNASGWNTTFFAGAGRIVSAGTHTAETAGIRLSCPLTTNLTFQMISAQWLHGPQTNGLVTSPSAASISSGLQINF
jgi:hypothetical protein